ncbi:MAG: WD40 repeat domain-containing protein [Cytophagales bacterium]|nr:MAG: WD40 repeat domain-containing protein [Cytophagales bacterium]
MQILTKIEKKHHLVGHKDCIYALAKTDPTQYLFSADGNGMVARWNLENPEIGELVAKVPNSVYAMQYDEEEKQLIIAQNFEGIHWINLQEKKEEKSLYLGNKNFFALQKHHQFLYVGDSEGTLSLIDSAEKKLLKTVQYSTKSLRALALNPKKKEIAAAYSDHHIRLLDCDTLQIKKEWKAHENSVFCLQYTKDGQYLLSGSRDAHLNIWNAEKDYFLEKSIVAHLFAINHIAISPSGKYFATASMDKSIKIWRIDSWQLLKVIDRARHAGHGTSINQLLWTDYQGYLISASDDRTLSVWEIAFAKAE